MKIKEVIERTGLTADTLRYYEKAGVIPPVFRSSGGIREYTEQDLAAIENAVCMRKAGLSIESLVRYHALSDTNDEGYAGRIAILEEQRQKVLAQQEEIARTLALLDYKLSKYRQAQQTGVLVWDRCCKKADKHGK